SYSGGTPGVIRFHRCRTTALRALGPATHSSGAYGIGETARRSAGIRRGARREAGRHRTGPRCAAVSGSRRLFASINIFLQLIAGPSEVRRGGLGSLLKAVAWISLVISPVLLLLLIQVQFLPYHLEWVTWVQCLAILADMILLWLTWPAVF